MLNGFDSRNCEDLAQTDEVAQQRAHAANCLWETHDLCTRQTEQICLTQLEKDLYQFNPKAADFPVM